MVKNLASFYLLQGHFPNSAVFYGGQILNFYKLTTAHCKIIAVDFFYNRHRSVRSLQTPDLICYRFTYATKKLWMWLFNKITITKMFIIYKGANNNGNFLREV
ncbi:hypothetical protein EDD80_12311 [Anseongella ginsenosidimutans]|uniref:Uncharacterized protein n=1 Tax=Anseongella ginsenosidimutans TaxID=496056 RepID=A0A4R3KKB1_9SPHI|nr:hypothetical protein EDD80_12311 [Anseongella ginsenosidimutans]